MKFINGWFTQPEDDLPQPDFPIDRSKPIENGRHAEALLNDHMLLAAFDAVAEKYRRAWELASVEDTETQILQHRRLSALKDVFKEIRVHLTNAQFREADEKARQRREEYRERFRDPLKSKLNETE